MRIEKFIFHDLPEGLDLTIGLRSIGLISIDIFWTAPPLLDTDDTFQLLDKKYKKMVKL